MTNDVMDVSLSLNLNDLVEYTGWEREKWHARFRQHGDGVLAMSAGPHGDGRSASVGDLVRHIFSAEQRYVERLTNRPLNVRAGGSTISWSALSWAENFRALRAEGHTCL